MWTDVVDLRDFYGRRLGRTAKRMIRGRIRAIWPDVSGQRVLGLGFATPYLSMFRGEAERVLAVMPAGHGVLHWPVGEQGLSALADETDLPLPDLSVDRVLIVHGIESAEQLRPMMREVWRVLTDSGRVIIVTPNRRGLWARFESTPFGFGRPFSRSQIVRLLRENMFMPLDVQRALFAPPVNWRLVQGSAAAWEKVGTRLFPAAAGVLVVEAAKQMYAQPVKTEGAADRAFESVRRPQRSLNRHGRSRLHDD